MRRKITTLNYLKLLILIALILIGLWPTLATAHGRRDVVDGKYQIMAGFVVEPIYVGLKNGIELFVCLGPCELEGNSQSGQIKNPLQGVHRTLKAELIYNGQVLPMELNPRFRELGKYESVFFPSRPGEYKIRFHGTINNDPLDITLTPGRDGFSEVEAQNIFPPVTTVFTLENQLKQANDRANTATIFGVIGSGLGLLSLIGLVFVWVRRLTTNDDNSELEATANNTSTTTKNNRRGSKVEGG